MAEYDDIYLGKLPTSFQPLTPQLLTELKERVSELKDGTDWTDTVVDEVLEVIDDVLGFVGKT